MGRTSAELKRVSRENLMGHWGLAIGASLLSALIVSAALMPFYFLMVVSRAGAVQSVAYVLAVLILGMVSVIMQCGILRMHLAFSRRANADLKMMFGEFTRRPERYVLAYLMVFGISLPCMLPGGICAIVAAEGGAVLAGIISLVLYLAGIIVLVAVVLRYSLVFLLLADDSQMNAMEAFRESARRMEGNKGRLLYIYLSFLGWGVLGMLSCGIGMLWIIPYMNQVTVNFYHDVAAEPEQDEMFEMM
ncbi:MAG: DUF975 family protein [Lachnospiraceae bacterium]|nr:DUF975 family protein [Lachnospiraceae bacterium]